VIRIIVGMNWIGIRIGMGIRIGVRMKIMIVIRI